MIRPLDGVGLPLTNACDGFGGFTVNLLFKRAQTDAVTGKVKFKLWAQTELDEDSYKNYPAHFYTQQDFNAPFASGSGQYDIMIIVPCSMGTLGRIAGGISNYLITRAADVNKLPKIDVVSSLGFVYDAIKATRNSLK